MSVTRQEFQMVLKHLAQHGINLGKDVHPGNLADALLNDARMGDDNYHALSTVSEGGQLARKLSTGVSQSTVDWLKERAAKVNRMG